MTNQYLGINTVDFFNIRVMQKNLVYVIGIPQKYAEESVLRRQEFFGQFGCIKKIIINKRSSTFDTTIKYTTDINRYDITKYSSDLTKYSDLAKLNDSNKLNDTTKLNDFKLPSYSNDKLFDKLTESTASAYITYSSDFEAKWCIQEVDESILDGKVIRCTFGTTKYCSFYLKNIPCQNNECMYLHECRHSKDILTKDELISTKHKLHDFECKNKNVERIGKKKRFDFLDDIFQFKIQTDYKPPRRIIFEPVDFTEY